MQVVDAAGARVVTGQVTVAMRSSDKPMPLMVTLPLLVTTYSKSTTSPMAGYVALDADLAMVSLGLATMAVLVVSGGLVVVPPPGAVPVTVAELFTVPASTSACVTVCVPVHVVLAPGASVVTGQTAAASSWPSTTAMPVMVTLPVLVTRNE